MERRWPNLIGLDFGLATKCREENMLFNRLLETLPILIKVVVFALMLVVGTDCTWPGLRDSLRRPGLTAAVVLGQFFFVPVVMYGCSRLLGSSMAVTASLLLIACCPTGSISNTYCYLARGNSSLSVALTTWSCLAAMVATPAVLCVAREILGSESCGLPLIPVVLLLRELGLMMTVPLVIGGMLRAWNPIWILEHQRNLRLGSLGMLIALLALIVGSGPSEIVRQIQEVVLVTALLTVILLALGWLLSRAFQLRSADHWAVMFEFPCRNLAIAAVVGLTVLNRPDLVRFAAALFVIQALTLLVLTRTMPGIRKRNHVPVETTEANTA